MIFSIKITNNTVVLLTEHNNWQHTADIYHELSVTGQNDEQRITNSSYNTGIFHSYFMPNKNV